MIKRKLSGLVAVALLFSGCSSIDFSMESMLAAPKLNELQTKIYTALLNSKGESVELVYPRSGDYRSAFVIENLDKEATPEAMVFYRATDIDNETMIRINFLDQENGEWISVHDIPAAGTQVEDLSFEKLSGSESTSVIISYSLINKGEKAVSVITYKDKTAYEIYKNTYSYKTLVPTGRDGKNELLLIKYDSTIESPVAYIAGWDGDYFSDKSSVPLDSEATSFTDCSVTQTVDGETAILLDSKISDKLSATQVLYCYNSKLTLAPQQMTGKFVRQINSLTADVTATDIDNDGILEIPATEALIGYENAPSDEQLNLHVWYSIDKSEAVEECRTYVSPRLDYYLKIPSRWHGFVTASVSSGEVIFSEYTDNEDELLAIKTVEKSKSAPEGWELLDSASDGKYSYYIKRPVTQSRFALTDDELQDLIGFF